MQKMGKKKDMQFTEKEKWPANGKQKMLDLRRKYQGNAT